MDDRELAIINCVMYDPDLYGSLHGEGKPTQITLGEWAANFNINSYMAKTEYTANGQSSYDPPRYGGGMLKEEMEAIVRSVLNDPVLASATIVDVSLRDAGGANATILSGDAMIVAYQGTYNDPEWWDDAYGGRVAVTDTPDQKAALRYFDDMVALYGSGCSEVDTTGHSKGGNLAAYVAVTSGQVDYAFSMDGQGFNAAFMLKYQLELRQQQSKITTYASSVDFVNILFGSVSGTTVYTEDPDLDQADRAMNHSPYAMLEVDEDGNVRLRPSSDQNPGMAMASDLMDYLMKYLSADEFMLLCDTAMDFKTQQFSWTDLLEDGVSMADAIKDILMGNVDCVKEPFRSLLQHVFSLLRAFYEGRGSNVEALWAIHQLLSNIGLPVIWEVVGEVVLPGFLSNAPPVPYWPEVRDYSEEVKQELLALVEKVTPHTALEKIVDWFQDLGLKKIPPELDFTADEATRREFYQKTIDCNNMTKQQIEAIFANVAQLDTAYANEARKWREVSQTLFQQLFVLSDALRG